MYRLFFDAKIRELRPLHSKNLTWERAQLSSPHQNRHLSLANGRLGWQDGNVITDCASKVVLVLE